MSPVSEMALREQLSERRHRLEAALETPGAAPRLGALLESVDAALERIDAGTYGLCETCREPIETDRLLADPLLCYCLDHLTEPQVRALEYDLATAARVQRGLLPPTQQTVGGWDIHYLYEPAGAVSGDYFDLVHDPAEHGGAFLVFGDVSGKGVSASILMSYLHAIFRGLLATRRPLAELVAQANRIFCTATLPSHFATVVCARLAADGSVELANAGHCAPLLVDGGEARWFEATGLPVGLFAEAGYESRTFHLDPGDALLFYTDGLSEARNGRGDEYGQERIAAALAGLGSDPGEPFRSSGHGNPEPRRSPGQGRVSCSAAALVRTCAADLQAFRSGAEPADDLTITAIRRLG